MIKKKKKERAKKKKKETKKVVQIEKKSGKRSEEKKRERLKLREVEGCICSLKICQKLSNEIELAFAFHFWCLYHCLCSTHHVFSSPSLSFA